MLTLLALALTCSFQGEGPSAEAIQRTVADSYDQLGGLSCDYEGRAYMSKVKGPTDLGLERVNFSGAFAVGTQKQAIALELFHFYVDPKDGNNNFHKLIICRDGKKELLSEGPYGSTGGEIGPNWAHAFDETGSLERIMPINAVRCFFQDRNYETKSEGVETVDGHPCYKLSVRSTQEVMKKFGGSSSVIAVYWFDLERGAHPLKIDWYVNRTAIHSRVVEVVLQRFKLLERQIWLPVQGKYQLFDEDGSVGWTEYYQVLQSSVTIRELPADRFTAKFKPGTRITDQLRRARYELGQDLRPPPTSRPEAERRLNEQIGQADAQKAVLDASRVANEGLNWSYALVLAATVTCVIALATLLVRRR